MRQIDKIRFVNAVRVGPEELYYAYNGGLKEYKIVLHDGYVTLNDVYIPMNNVTQFTLCPTVKPK